MVEEDQGLRNTRLAILKSYQEVLEYSEPGISADPEKMLDKVISDGAALAWWRHDDHAVAVLASLIKPAHEWGGFRYDGDSRVLDMPNGESVQFTKTEGVVFLPLIARAPNLVIFRVLETTVSRQQLRVSISRIREKIGDTSLLLGTRHGQFRIIQTIIGVGYRFNPDSEEPVSLLVNPPPLIIEGTGSPQLLESIS